MFVETSSELGEAIIEVIDSIIRALDNDTAIFVSEGELL